MLRHQGYSFRLRGLADAQAQTLAEMDGQARWLSNLFLKADRQRRKNDESPATFAERCIALTWLRSWAKLGWVKNDSAPVEQAILRNLADAWA